MENKNIDELLSKYFSGEALPEEAMFLEEWKKMNKENQTYFEQSEKIFYPQQDKADAQQAWNKVKGQISQTLPDNNSYKFVWKAAASIALALGLSTAIYFLTQKDTPTQLLYIASSSPVHTVLSDGTDIQLSPNSQLTLANDFGKASRKLFLKGSAYFSVIHEEEKPFIVDAGGVFIKDLGTKFLIRTSADTDTVHVRVDEGIVLLFDSLHSEVEIKAGSNAMYVKSIGKILTPKAAVIPHMELSFNNIRLAEMVKKLSDTYQVKIEIANPALNNCLITTRFQNEKIETILSIITETLNIAYKKTETGYVISGEHCIQ